jgi:uncharacterized protein (TIGR02145 family)
MKKVKYIIFFVITFCSCTNSNTKSKILGLEEKHKNTLTIIGFLTEKFCSEDTGVIINGIKWATRNIDKSGTFTLMPEIAGKHYQWNRKKEWNITDEFIADWDITVPEGTEWEKANNPCPKGWRVPTYYEIKSLLDRDKVAREWATQNGIKGYKFTDKTTNASIFLPAASCRNENGKRASIYAERYYYYTFYWSSTWCGNIWGFSRDVNEHYACSFGCESYSYVQIYVNYREKGLLIRPVADVQTDAIVRKYMPTLEDTIYREFDKHLENFLSTQTFKLQDMELYWLRDLEDNTKLKVGFVSFSDNYQLSESPDSLAIPDVREMEKEHLQYFKLGSEYRKRFLAGTKISETDTVFIYDYATDVLHSFSVKNLNVVAYLNDYMTPDNCSPCHQYDYMIGFEIKKQFLTGMGDYYSNVLVYVGKENPFARGQMKAIVWKKIDFNDFPLTKAKLQTTNLPKGNVYLYESDEFHYFLQDLVRIRNYNGVWARHLLVIDKKNEEVVAEKLVCNNEGSSPADLNFGIDREDFADSTIDYANYIYQWTGKLFKNKPLVVFGLEWVSFGCPSIILLDPAEESIDINCDNRH